MSDKVKVTTSSGCGLTTILLVIFVVLKALGLAFQEWSWIKTILMPIAITFGAALALFVGIMLFLGIIAVILYLADR